MRRSARRQTVARDVQRGAGRRAAGENERAAAAAASPRAGRSAARAARRPSSPTIALVDARRELVGGIGELGAEREQIALELRRGSPSSAGSSRDARTRPSQRVELVDLAVGVDARVVFARARAAEERRLAGIAGSRVDFHVAGLYEMLSSEADAPAADPAAARSPPRSGSACSTGIAATAAICRGARPTIRITSSSRRSCCSRRRSIACCRSTPSGSTKYPSLERARRPRRSGRDRHVASARLQHPAAAAAVDRARVGRAIRRRAAVRRGDAAVVQGHRRVHRRRDPQLRVRRARRDPRHQRRARAVPRSSSARAIRRATR